MLSNVKNSNSIRINENLWKSYFFMDKNKLEEGKSWRITIWILGMVRYE